MPYSIGKILEHYRMHFINIQDLHISFSTKSRLHLHIKINITAVLYSYGQIFTDLLMKDPARHHAADHVSLLGRKLTFYVSLT